MPVVQLQQKKSYSVLFKWADKADKQKKMTWIAKSNSYYTK